MPQFRAVVAGGGPAALEAVLALRRIAPDVAVTLLAPDPILRYRALAVAVPFAAGVPRRYAVADVVDPGVDRREDALAAVDVAGRAVLTASGATVPYDALLVATGALARPGVEHALTFDAGAGAEAMHGLIQDLEGGWLGSVAFVAPPGATWTLPLHELALLTADRARSLCLDDVQVSVTTPEAAPLEAFGPEVAAAAAGWLETVGVRFRTGTTAPRADRVVALPVPLGMAHPGLPADPGGFLPVDALGRVRGAERVFAAGDGTDRTPRQGGLATEQADDVARAIAALAAGEPEPAPRPRVLRGMLLTGDGAWYLSRPLDEPGPGVASRRPLWWPPAKVAGERLASRLDELDELAGRPGLERAIERRRVADGVVAARRR